MFLLIPKSLGVGLALTIFSFYFWIKHKLNHNHTHIQIYQLSKTKLIRTWLDWAIISFILLKLISNLD